MKEIETLKYKPCLHAPCPFHSNVIFSETKTVVLYCNKPEILHSGNAYVIPQDCPLIEIKNRELPKGFWQWFKFILMGIWYRIILRKKGYK